MHIYSSFYAYLLAQVVCVTCSLWKTDTVNAVVVSNLLRIYISSWVSHIEGKSFTEMIGDLMQKEIVYTTEILCISVCICEPNEKITS